MYMSSRRRWTRRGALILLLTMLLGLSAWGAESWLHVFEGTLRQETTYAYTVHLEPENRRFDVTLPLLPDVRQPWYRVSILDQWIEADVPWSNQWEETDPWGWPNVWSIQSWNTSAESLDVTRHVRAISEALYGPIRLNDPFPLEPHGLPVEAYDQSIPKQEIQAGDRTIVSLAEGLVEGARTQLEAVVRILGYIRDEVRYACGKDLCDPVLRVDAVATLEKGVGNCVCYANLALALLRAVGIPSAEAATEVEAQVTPSVAVAWALTVHIDDWEAHTLSLSLDGVPDGWYAAFSQDQIAFNPDDAPDNSLDILLTVIPSANAQENTSFDVAVLTGGIEAGRVTFHLDVDS